MHSKAPSSGPRIGVKAAKLNTSYGSKKRITQLVDPAKSGFPLLINEEKPDAIDPSATASEHQQSVNIDSQKP